MSWPRMLEALTAHGRRLAVAESFTGGALLDTITNAPGASGCLAGGVVAYEDESKKRDLGVRLGTLRLHGAVSEPVAHQMAEGVRRRFEADYGLATSGIAGPTGATPFKPLGVSVVAIAYQGGSMAETKRHTGDRGDVKQAAAQQVLTLLERRLRWEGIL